MGWTVRGSNPSGKDRFIVSPERPDLLREPTRDLFDRHRGYFQQQSGWELKIPTDLYLVTKIGMSGAMPPFPLRVFTTWTRKTLNFLYFSHIYIFPHVIQLTYITGTIARYASRNRLVNERHAFTAYCSVLLAHTLQNLVLLF